MNKTIGIVGLGLIGASIALSLKDKVKGIVAVDRDPEVIRMALERGLITAGSTSPEEALFQADLVILALYPEDIVHFALKHKAAWKPGQILMDVAGLKGKIVETLQEELPVEFIGTHPMAGREVGGLKSAREELFLGTNFILTPTPRNTPVALDFVEELAGLLGVKNLFRMTPKEHDRLIAYTSHMPHLLALALMGVMPTGAEKIVGRSFQDATRVANINETLWAELFLENKGELCQQIDKFVEELEKYKKILLDNDKIELEHKLVLARSRKERINQ